MSFFLRKICSRQKNSAINAKMNANANYKINTNLNIKTSSKTTSKILFILTLSMVILNFSGCKKKETNVQVLESAVQKKSAQESTKIDIDLTKLSATAIYSIAFNMLIEPELYENKIIRAKGNFNSFINENTKERNFAILIPDATACCQQLIEFEWTGNHSYPEDYPALDDEIIITGVFSTSELGNGLTYTFLKVFDLISSQS